MESNWKALLGVVFDQKQAQTELQRQIKSLQKASKLALNIDISDKDAKNVINNTSKAWSNYRKEAVAAVTAPNTELKKMKQYYTDLEREIQRTAKAQQSLSNLALDKSSFGNSITAYIQGNSKLPDSYKNELYGIKDALESADKVQFNNLKKNYQEVTSRAKALNLEGKSFGDIIKNDISKFAQWTISATVLMSSINAVRSMVSSVIDLNTVMTSLRKVTDETDETYSKFLDDANVKAQKLGTSLSTFIGQTAEWSKAGFNLIDSTKLAEISTIFQNVGDVDAATSIADIVTPLKAFNIEAQKSITVVDKLNEVDNRFSVSASGIGEGLRNSASALSLAGNDINQAIAMITGGTEIECVSPSTVMYWLCA